MQNDTTSTRDIGDQGEEMAAEHLLANGYSIISRQYRSKKGEIDCIAQDSDGTIVFVEVKSANSLKFGNPLQWVTRSKQLTIITMAKQYLYEHKMNTAKCRFDVIAVLQGKIKHLKNAFTA
jgi:putative endonuclease